MAMSKRPVDSHKGMFGKVTVIGGAQGMTGAALLAGRAALKLGAGGVHVVLLADNAPGVDILQPELMLHSSGKSESSHHFELGNSDVLVAGCGMGNSATARQLLFEVLSSPVAMVLDADALNLIAQHASLRDLLLSRESPSVLTPHPGEAARLLSCRTSEIQSNRIASVEKLAKQYNCSVLLKGAHTLCVTRDGLLYENQTGNPGMSAPGMGDVLSGMIGAFIAQGLSCDDAMRMGVHLHGAAGDELAKTVAIGMTAGELIDQARLLLNQWR
jgi:hydroxyethylthiazole kinase-like uncharacterized protein yjeF